MSPWTFVIAAYGLAAVATLTLVIRSLVAMRSAEAAADKPRR